MSVDGGQEAARSGDRDKVETKGSRNRYNRVRPVEVEATNDCKRLCVADEDDCG